jgi:DNA repair protein RadA/Sms
MGFCPQCRVRDPLEAEITGTGPGSVAVTDIEAGAHQAVGVAEIDRVLGGGLVPGGSVLVGGEPGVGKSTLLLQLADAFGHPAAVVTAEESVEQVALRAERLGVSNVFVSAAVDVDVIVAQARELSPRLLVVDSIQTVAAPGLDAPVGGVSQVKECAGRLVRLAKETGIAVVMVGHVTKDGSLAGPKQLEHLVDVVLSLEGEAEDGLRVLRCLKNRFGDATEVGLFQMTGAGLVEVTSGDALLGEWEGDIPGSVAFPAISGRRPVLVEVQALVGPAAGNRRVVVSGVEGARVQQILAVLDRHAGFSFEGLDVYVSVSQGVKLADPASDLAVAIALVSCLLYRPAGRTAAWGEISLTGEVRVARGAERRRTEVGRLGLRAIAPNGRTNLTTLLGQAGLHEGGSGPVLAFAVNGQPDAAVDPGGASPPGTRHGSS